MLKIKIGDKTIGEDFPTYIIAEAGVNHNGDINLAKRLIDMAKEAGCDAVKFQTFKTERLVTKQAAKAEYQRETTYPGESQFEVIKKLEMSSEGFYVLKEYATQKGIIFLSTPFDKESVDLLVELEVPAIKVGSGEITNLPLLKLISNRTKLFP